VTEPSHAVFLSYASQDAPAAQRICEALRSAGIEVWFDQSELRGGDVWDQKIRREIRDCALFIAVISANTASRHEGYFRLEWDLADQRTHMMARNRAFILPVSPDATPEAGADVPESFQRVQWTRLPNGETPPALVERVQRLLSPEPSTTPRAPARAQSGAVGIIRAPVQASWSPKRGLLMAVGLVVLGAAAYFAIEKLWISKPAVSSPTVATSPAPAAFSPPPHSIAVLPFANVSGDKEQEYFSEGLSEEVLNSLADINGLQVAGRTSSFYFKGKDVDLGTIAHKLNVAAVLEGSVQRSAGTIRVTTQLTNAVTGFQVWSKTYDRPLGDVLKLQTDIATAVASALKVTLLGDEVGKIESGGTRNPAAFDAYLRGSKAYSSQQGASSSQNAIDAYTEAIRLDPNYALAFASRSHAFSSYASEFATGSAIREFFDNAQADALKAIKLAPELAEAHLALAWYWGAATLDFMHASEEFERALALAPGNADVLSEGGRFAVLMGRFDAGFAAARRAVALDPLSTIRRIRLGHALYWARRYQDAVTAFGAAISLDPEDTAAHPFRGLAYYGLGDFQNARSTCETKPDDWASEWCLAVTYNKLGRQADAEAALKKIQVALGDACAYQYATIYAQWGDTAKALEWLETAMRVRDPGLTFLKVDPLLDPLRNAPRFQAIQRELKFPE
jgi:TolB-like protein/Tfp pilus assembly protein PilF